MDRQCQPQSGAGALFQTASEDRTGAGPYWIKSTVQLAPTHVSSDHPVGASGTNSWSTAIPVHRRSAGQAPSFLLQEAPLGAPAHPATGQHVQHLTQHFPFRRDVLVSQHMVPRVRPVLSEPFSRVPAWQRGAPTTDVLADVLLGVDGAEGCRRPKQRGK